jgi:protein involved in polysaccharide export with SLBB domain
MHAHGLSRKVVLMSVWTVGIAFVGVLLGAEKGNKAAPANVPRELAMRPLPAYRIAPPDIIAIEVTTSDGTPTSGVGTSFGVGKAAVSGSGFIVGNVSGGGSLNKTGTGTLVLSAKNTYTGSSINTGRGDYYVGGTGETYLGHPNVNGGTLSFGDYSGTQTQTPGTVKPGDSNQAQIDLNWEPSEKVRNQTTKPLDKSPIEKNGSEVAQHPVTGQYLVAPDGTVNLHRYGMVQVMGKTVKEAEAAVKKQVSKYLASPEVSVEIAAYNSKVFYVIIQGAGLGDNVRRVPITGNDTVLDALSVVNGLSQVSSRKMWIARPSPANSAKGKIMPVDYVGITQQGATATNYQILPGDRLFIAEDKTIAVNNWVAKKTASIERVMGLISLGASTVKSVASLWPKSPNDRPTREEPDE